MEKNDNKLFGQTIQKYAHDVLNANQCKLVTVIFFCSGTFTKFSKIHFLIVVQIFLDVSIM